MDIKLIDFRPRGVPDGDVYEFEVDGHPIGVELWSTDATSGQEVLDLREGKYLADLDQKFGPGTQEAIDRLVERASELWMHAWGRHIYEVHERERLKLIEAMQVEYTIEQARQQAEEADDAS